jgi:hypothetical protein
MAEEPEPFPERRHLGALIIKLAQDHEEANLRWAEWASEQVGSWRATDDPGDWDPESVYAALAGSGHRDEGAVLT